MVERGRGVVAGVPVEVVVPAGDQVGHVDERPDGRAVEFVRRGFGAVRHGEHVGDGHEPRGGPAVAQVRVQVGDEPAAGEVFVQVGGKALVDRSGQVAAQAGGGQCGVGGQHPLDGAADRVGAGHSGVRGGAQDGGAVGQSGVRARGVVQVVEHEGEGEQVGEDEEARHRGARCEAGRQFADPMTGQRGPPIGFGGYRGGRHPGDLVLLGEPVPGVQRGRERAPERWDRWRTRHRRYLLREG